MYDSPLAAHQHPRSWEPLPSSSSSWSPSAAPPLPAGSPIGLVTARDILRAIVLTSSGVMIPPGRHARPAGGAAAAGVGGGGVGLDEVEWNAMSTGSFFEDDEGEAAAVVGGRQTDCYDALNQSSSLGAKEQLSSDGEDSTYSACCSDCESPMEEDRDSMEGVGEQEEEQSGLKNPSASATENCICACSCHSRDRPSVVSRISNPIGSQQQQQRY